ncbi:MAG: biotin/lipoyl-binding protein [Halieaceae bacterium]|jgi:biotin carboxyl carrier protein|nr:biotin/lipoyl-binding protein [Halieaceae bacterium]
MKRQITLGVDTYGASIIRKPAGSVFSINDGALEPIQLESLGLDKYRITVGEHSTEAKVAMKGEAVFIEAFGEVFFLQVLDPVEQAREASEEGDLSAKSPMPGIVVEIHVKEGDKVEADQALLTIESMKLLTIVRAAGAGTIASLNYNAGDAFDKGAVLAVVHAPEDDHA